MKINLGKLPKVKIKLTTLLGVLLALAIFVEIFTLYKYGYLNLSRDPEIKADAARQILDIKSYMSLRAWIERNNSYLVTDTQLSTEAQGRDNPFVDY